MANDPAKDEDVRLMYPDEGLKNPVRPFENSLAETVKRLFKR